MRLNLVWILSLSYLLCYSEKDYISVNYDSLKYWDTKAVWSGSAVYGISTTFETYFEIL